MIRRLRVFAAFAALLFPGAARAATIVALMLGPLVGVLLLFATSASFDFVNLVSSAVYVFVLPFAAIASTYMYFDLRVEKQIEDAAEETADVLPRETPPSAVPATP
jgi:hypothetical protein